MEREFIDKQWLLSQPMDKANYPSNYVKIAKVYTEKDFVKPYLQKVLMSILEDEFLQKNMSGEVWERVEDIINNLLSEDGEEE